jgi:hypothetical protein
MNSQRFIVTRENQFSSKKANRTASAMAPIEQKLEKLVQLQRLSCELAQQTGRQGKKPWPVRSSEN